MTKQRRNFSPQFKVDAVMELLTGAKPPSAICRERNITDKLLYRWKQEFLERVPQVFESERGQRTDTSSAQRIEELERLVGRLALENELLKNAASWRAEHPPRSAR